MLKQLINHKNTFLPLLFMLLTGAVLGQNISCDPNIDASATVTFDPAVPTPPCVNPSDMGCAKVIITDVTVPPDCENPVISVMVGQGCGGAGGSVAVFDVDCNELMTGDGALMIPLTMAPDPNTGSYEFIICRPGNGPIQFSEMELLGCCTIEGTCNLMDQDVEGCGIGDLPAALTDPADVFTGFVSMNCGNPVLVVSEATVTPDLPITVTRTYEYFDDANNNGIFDIDEMGITCSHDLTIDDTTPPNAECQDVTIQLDVTGVAFLFPVNLDPTMSVDNGSNDACGLAVDPFTLSRTEFGCDDIGVVTVTLTVEDANGNISTCMAQITVEDNVPPTVTCQTVTLQLDDNGNAVLDPNTAVLAINEACGPVTVTASQTDFDCTDVGQIDVTITVTDGSMNSGTCVASIIIEDVTPPMAICNNVTLILDDNGNASTTAVDVGGQSTDNCGIATLALDRTDFTCADIGNTTVTLTVTDVNGLMSTCMATVTVIDDTPPMITCMPFTVALDDNGIATINLADVLATASDNCGLQPGGQVSLDAFNCGNLGTNTVTVTVTDVNGLSSSCQATVTVIDDIPPVADCQDITIELDENGFATIDATQIDAGSTDNCNMTTLEVSPNTFFCGNVGPNSVTLVVTDQSGNVATCTATVTVLDLIPPVANCQDVTIFLDENGNASVSPQQVDNGSNDACGIADLTLSQTDFTCANIGNQNPVTLTVTDVNGNISTCTANITVIDDMPAQILCRPPVNTVNDPGVCGADVLLLPPLILEENCSITSVSNDAPALFPVGTTTVTWTIVDAGGNVSTCVQTVTVNDTEDPVIDCGNSFTAFTSWENCGYPSFLLEGATATDNCGVISLTDDAPEFFPPGQYMVNYTATDAAGNTAMCMQWVKIYDTTLPKLVTCPEDQTVFATTTFGANASWDLPTGMDNCPGDLILVEANGYAPGAFFELGDTDIAYQLYDQNGNFVKCDFTISVIPEPQPLTMTCLETIEISTQEEVNLQTIAWNSPLIQSLCEECEVLKSDDFEHVGNFQGHNYYLFNSDEMSWNQAQQMANNLGGYLTIIGSDKENTFLATELEEDVNAWIGLADLQGNGEANWVDGTAFEISNWQEELAFIEDTPTAFKLDNEGNWEIGQLNESHYFLFEVPCYELEMTTDNPSNLATPNSSTFVNYEITDMCGNTTSCYFQLNFTDAVVDYCEEGSIVTDSASQHFINQFFIEDNYYNESGNDDGYGDFSNEYILLTPGEILDIYADFGPFDAEHPLYCRIWIDLNADGDFYDEGELISQAIDILEMQGQLTVPLVDESIEQTRLRIGISRFGYPEPCGASENGEMEDYTITFDHENTAQFMQVNLQGERVGFNAQLSWVTQSNVDIQTYDVERSLDGVNFEKITIGLVDETTKSMPKLYNSLDKKPDLGQNYYRLEVFPKNGASFYTNVVNLKFNDEQQRITLYPNPADEQVTMHIEGAEGLPAHLKIYTVFGQEMYEVKFNELTESQISIPLNRFVDGTYFVYMTIDGQRPIVEKLVVDKLNGYRPALD